VERIVGSGAGGFGGGVGEIVFRVQREGVCLIPGVIDAESAVAEEVSEPEVAIAALGETDEAEVRRIAFLNWTRTRPRGILWEFSLVLELQLVEGSFRESTIDSLRFIGELHTVNA
jgi:hypothetical protein